MARLEEYCGDVPKARELLTAAREHSKQDWKVFLESVLLERRVGVNDAAVSLSSCSFSPYNPLSMLPPARLLVCASGKAGKGSFAVASGNWPFVGGVWRDVPV